MTWRPGSGSESGSGSTSSGLADHCITSTSTPQHVDGSWLGTATTTHSQAMVQCDDGSWMHNVAVRARVHTAACCRVLLDLLDLLLLCFAAERRAEC